LITTGVAVGRLVQPTHQHRRFGRGLHLEPELGAERHAGGVDVGQRGRAVDVGLARAEPGQVGTVQHEHARHDETSA
jgi:hypothetical protein